MKMTFELVTYNDELNGFEIDENTYQINLSQEDAQTYKLLESSELSLYNWLQESEFFINYINEEVYQDSKGKKFAISDINGISFVRFYFFKITSGDAHYDYFKKLFKIHVESEWQDREDTGREILENLLAKQKELMFELS